MDGSEDDYKEDFQYEPQDIDGDYEDGTEEIEEIDEEAYLALIDKQSSPLQTCKQLLFPLVPFQSGLNILTNEGITSFYQKGFAIHDNIMNRQEIEQIYSYTLRKHQENALSKPHDAVKDHDASARDDLHMWFSESNSDPALAPGKQNPLYLNDQSSDREIFTVKTRSPTTHEVDCTIRTTTCLLPARS